MVVVILLWIFAAAKLSKLYTQKVAEKEREAKAA